MPAAVIAQPAQAQAVHSIPYSTLVILLIVAVIVLFILAVFLVVIIRWLKGFLQKRLDLLYTIKVERLKLCSIHATMKVHKFRIKKNLPLRLAWTNNNKVQISAPIAYYGGHYLSGSGKIYLQFFSPAYKMIPILPFSLLPLYEPQLLVIPQRNLLQFSQTDVILWSESIDQFGTQNFFFPILKDKDGNIIDGSSYVFEDLRASTMTEAVSELLNTLPPNIRKAVDSNPQVRIVQKTGDSSSTIEQLPKEQQR